MKLSFEKNSCILPASLSVECVSSNCLLYGEDVNILEFPKCSLENEDCFISDTYNATSKPCQTGYHCATSNETFGRGVCKRFDSHAETSQSEIKNGSSDCINEICKVKCNAGFFNDKDICKKVSSGNDFEYPVMHVQS